MLDVFVLQGLRCFPACSMHSVRPSEAESDILHWRYTSAASDESQVKIKCNRRNSRNLNGIKGGTAAQWHKTWAVHHGAWSWARPWAWSRPHWWVEEPVVTGCDKEKLHLRHGTTKTLPFKRQGTVVELAPPRTCHVTRSCKHTISVIASFSM